MEFSFSAHALEQMERRNLNPDLIREILNNPDHINDTGSLKVYQSIIELEQNSRFLLRVFVNTEKVPALVVTVYKTSKIEKYHEGEI